MYASASQRRKFPAVNACSLHT